MSSGSFRDTLSMQVYKAGMSDFPTNLKTMRTAKRMSQAELGDVLGISRAAVQQWENGRTTPSLQNLTELARFFDVPFAELLGSPAPSDSVDAELRELPDDIAALLKKSFLTTIRTMKPPSKV